MKKGALLLVCLAASLLRAASYPAPVEGDWVVHDFRFHTGETLPDLKLHYTTVGANSGAPVLILHGSGGAGTGFLRDNFAGELFGPGQPLDARTHFIILPDAIGSGKSSKPSDGLRMRFPRYTYYDMVRAQYRLVAEHLGLRHLRLIIGGSAGGMQTWMWGEMYPGFMDALMPMAAMPVEVAGRNWMLRRMLIDAIRNDPEWKDGNYEKQPSGLQRAFVYFVVATTGGTQAIYNSWPTREQADAELDRRLAQPVAADANDVLYEYEAARDYNPDPDLEKIQARLTAVNSADDERNPAELGIMEREIKRVKNGRYMLIPTGPETRGHGTVAIAKLWKSWLVELLSDTK
jgi:homoserine O-acetyltransferase